MPSSTSCKSISPQASNIQPNTATARKSTASKDKHGVSSLLSLFSLFTLIAVSFLHLRIPRLLELSQVSSRPALLTVTHGGLGNQIYVLLEAMMLARQAGFIFVPPSIPPRHIQGIPHSSKDHPADKFWDLKLMSRFTTTSQQPPSCAHGITNAFLLQRGKKLVEAQISSGLLHLACDLDPNQTQPISVRECGETALRKVLIKQIYLDHSLAGDDSLLEELRQIREGCVVIDGPSYTFSGEIANNYLYSLLHYVEASEYVQELMRKLWKPGMTVFHLRYDEHNCDTNRTNVCIRRKLEPRKNDTMVYVPVGGLVNAILRKMHAEKSTSIYVAASPYVPTRILKPLLQRLAKDIEVVERFQASDEAIVNFVERELAINAQVFIGDFGSTWSGNVYYKRRTMGKKSAWSCKVVGLCTDLAFHTLNGKLNNPHWFEKMYNISHSE
ncbi:hypothetical protein BWQ96_06021 [Gracilariopsis chorda]|uniref:Uncharacterized protein n=1 Tax=Gracilariopsis chorda TaxID=448386 RepID=A0A2V3IT03_9FLOR|nr:hypothetical protein BWQ96_06021 [Gracilariopsis chorda]|eukprot:PXF44240.1 hypothetical protein BWQ96_06021 [Gracilariopsis chorda]